jgi:phosphohistidine phosphatase SixA
MLFITALTLGACAAEPQTIASPTSRSAIVQTTVAGPIATPRPPTFTPTIEPTATVRPSPTSSPPTLPSGAALVDALRKGGYVIYFRHALTETAQTGGETQNLANCEQQPNLNENGRASASLIGQAFQALGIPVDRVLSSAYCRARHTAQIAFGKTEIAAELTGLPEDLPAERSAVLDPMLSTPPRAGTNTVLVGDDLILAGTVDDTMVEGEAAIFAPLGADGFTLVSRLLPEGWADLAGLDGSVVQSQADQAGEPTGTPASPTSPALTQTGGSSAPQSTGTPLLPDLQTLPPSDLVIEMNTAGGPKLLRLTNSILNRGPGVMELQGVADQASGRTIVTQRIYSANGLVEQLATGDFVFHPGHTHWHLENFARYEVWTLTSQGELDGVVALTDKVSFCLRDNTRVDIPGAAPQAVYTNCNREVQGISAGWIDTYDYDTQGQIVDITGLPDGEYALRSTTDPEDQLRESDEGNNAAMVYIEIEGNQVSIIDSPGG